MSDFPHPFNSAMVMGGFLENFLNSLSTEGMSPFTECLDLPALFYPYVYFIIPLVLRGSFGVYKIPTYFLRPFAIRLNLRVPGI